MTIRTDNADRLSAEYQERRRIAATKPAAHIEARIKFFDMAATYEPEPGELVDPDESANYRRAALAYRDELAARAVPCFYCGAEDKPGHDCATAAGWVTV